MMTKNLFIIGADGQIGAYLYNRFKNQLGVNIHGTTRRQSCQEDKIYLDLENANCQPSDVNIGPNDIVVFTAAITRRDLCAHDVEKCHHVNVQQTVHYLHDFMKRGAYCIFLSSNIVLGGAQPHLPINSDYAPIDAYSSAKAMAEKRLLALGKSNKNLAILRLTKVMDGATPLIKGWQENLRNNREITTFTNLFIAPITTNIIGDAVENLAATKKAGIYHLSCKDEVSYYDFAHLLFAENKKHLIKPTLQNMVENDNIHNSLDTNDSEQLLAITCPTIYDVIHHLRINS